MNYNDVTEKLSYLDNQMDSINLVPATFDKTNQIGQGTFGKVYKSSYYTKDNELKTVAIKKIPMSSQDEGLPLTAVREIAILQAYHHPNLVELLDIIIAPVKPPNYRGHVDLIFEYMEHDISALVESKIQFTQGEIKNIMKQILTGIAYLHSNNIIHRDIKSANILLNNNGVVKLGDFGLARTICPLPQRNKLYSGNVVTIWYRPPELLLGMKNYDLKVDMWSIGCVFAELLMGEPIFKGNNEKEQVQEIFTICGSPNENTWPGISLFPSYEYLMPRNTFDNNLKLSITSKSKSPIDDITFDLIQKMLMVNPRDRISAEEALKHEYFSDSHQVKIEEIRKINKEYHNLRLGKSEMSTSFKFEKFDSERKSTKEDLMSKRYYNKNAVKRGRIVEIKEDVEKKYNETNMMSELNDPKLMNALKVLLPPKK